MCAFKRGLSQEFVELLNDAYKQGGWWKKIADDEELFIGIRNEYLNVYFKGNSLLALSHDNGKLVGKTHYKYLLHPDKEPLSVDIENGQVSKSSLDATNRFVNKLDEINLLKRASTPYAGLEKKGIHEIIKANPNIVDVEIAITKESMEKELISEDDESQKSNKTAPRIDFAAFQQRKDKKIELVFFEAKHILNRESLRANNTPKVITQLEKYEKLIEKHYDQIKESYLQIVKYILEIKGKFISNEKRKLLRHIADNETKIDVCRKPHLVIFGFDGDQKNEKSIWNQHKKKLEEHLGKGRVLAKGDPKDFQTGIKFYP